MKISATIWQRPSNPLMLVRKIWKELTLFDMHCHINSLDRSSRFPYPEG